MKKAKLLSIAAIILAAVFLSQSANTGHAEMFEKSFTACKVKNDNTDFFVSATETTIKLRKGTALSWTTPGLHQGLIVVKAKVGKKWIKGEILLDETTCN